MTFCRPTARCYEVTLNAGWRSLADRHFCDTVSVSEPLALGRRVIVTGLAGSGKSTFALALAGKTDLPVIHLDLHFWKPGWVEPTASLASHPVKDEAPFRGDAGCARPTSAAPRTDPCVSGVATVGGTVGAVLGGKVDPVLGGTVGAVLGGKVDPVFGGFVGVVGTVCALADICDATTKHTGRINPTTARTVRFKRVVFISGAPCRRWARSRRACGLIL